MKYLNTIKGLFAFREIIPDYDQECSRLYLIVKDKLGKDKENLSEKSRRLVESFPLRHIESIFAATKSIG